MAPAATMAGSAGVPASTSTPITISTVIANKNVSTGLTNTATAIKDDGAQVRRFLTVLPPAYIDFGQIAPRRSSIRPGFLFAPAGLRRQPGVCADR
jgi:hypothetical protein